MVNVSGAMLEEIAGVEVTDETLISLPKFTKLSYNKDSSMLTTFSC